MARVIQKRAESPMTFIIQSYEGHWAFSPLCMSFDFTPFVY